MEVQVRMSARPFDKQSSWDQIALALLNCMRGSSSHSWAVSCDDESAARLSGFTNVSLAELLDRHTVVGKLWQAEGTRVRCFACGHRCLIGEGKRGICRVRFNQGGQLRVPYGYVAGIQCDPVEKKPFNHVYPGSDALTFGMMGCDFHCGYCQNWVTSQTLRDEASHAPVTSVSPEQIASAAAQLGARLVVSSYNEPLITAEWAVAVFEHAAQAGLECAFVSNGNITPEALALLRRWIIAYKIDLKSFDDKRYRCLGGTLDNVTRGVRLVHEQGIWLEVVTLLVPGFNDSEGELRALARFLGSVSPDIPWHVTAFHKDYKMTNSPNTMPAQLIRAAEIGAEEGLDFVYAGNAPGRVGNWEHTWCPRCREKLVERFGYLVTGYHLTPDGHCPKCGYDVPGVWPSTGAADVRLGDSAADYYSRQPRVIRLGGDRNSVEPA
jgi:pyruvate formate lyase activating enzyme